MTQQEKSRREVTPAARVSGGNRSEKAYVLDVSVTQLDSLEAARVRILQAHDALTFEGSLESYPTDARTLSIAASLLEAHQEVRDVLMSLKAQMARIDSDHDTLQREFTDGDPYPASPVRELVR